MPRYCTDSAIKKAKRTDVQQAEVTRGRRIGYSRWNHCKNKVKSNARNSAWMAENRDKILLKSKDKRMSEHMKKFGPDAIWWYKMHKGTRTVGLDGKDEEQDGGAC
ncbi:hypothetical protein BT96DRAFT_946045 [Gymnopus androsaceus JB14]|uniref:Uncharacterized protein n=1 Tax=Gymnopus androsaceus JB14 TaxID=1447944 RepID=A0A6A4GXT5_9AGAR|nr:hypothetical protein BT96DRAFT_946045 [Gymnopus androsaceus JB14]